MKEKRLTVIDTTLRDGEQSAGVAFTPFEKIKIAKLLDEMGVNIIEAGIPMMGKEEQRVIYEMQNLDLNAEILTWNRMNKHDLMASYETGAVHAHISVPVSDIHITKKLGITRKRLKEELKRILEFGDKLGLIMSLGAEDASRADMDFLTDIYTIGIHAGITRIRYADTVSVLNPFSAKMRIEALVENLSHKCAMSQGQLLDSISIDFHGHNDFGLGTANALGAFKGGADVISCSVNGLGERAGNTPLEEIVVALQVMDQITSTIDIKKIMHVSKIVEQYSGRINQKSKPIVGEMVFSHEAGIHVDGLLKDRSIYEYLQPEWFGRQHILVNGKHSGKSKSNVLERVL